MGRCSFAVNVPCSWLRPLVVLFSRGVFFMGGFHWVEVKGKRALPSEAPLLATAPHSTYFDGLPVTFLGLTSVVAKSTASNVPFFGSECGRRPRVAPVCCCSLNHSCCCMPPPPPLLLTSDPVQFPLINAFTNGGFAGCCSGRCVLLVA